MQAKEQKSLNKMMRFCFGDYKLNFFLFSYCKQKSLNMTRFKNFQNKKKKVANLTHARATYRPCIKFIAILSSKFRHKPQESIHFFNTEFINND